MTPGEHYCEAERLLFEAFAIVASGPSEGQPLHGDFERDELGSRAQVHATLATCGYRSSMGGDSSEAVSDV